MPIDFFVSIYTFRVCLGYLQFAVFAHSSLQTVLQISQIPMVSVFRPLQVTPQVFKPSGQCSSKTLIIFWQSHPFLDLEVFFGFFI